MSFHTGLLPLYAFSLHQAKNLTADLPVDRWTHQPAPQTNHAAWVIGHLAYCGDALIGLLGEPMHSPADWEKLFGITSEPVADATTYPEPATLLAALEETHNRLNELVPRIEEAKWNAAPLSPELAKHFPTLGEFGALILATHEPFHLGQLSTWRRVQGLPRV